MERERERERVLHVLPMNKLSGAEKVALLICENMIKYKPIVICGGETLKKIFREQEIKSYSIDFQQKNKFMIIKGIKEIVKKENIKIIHAHDNIASIYSYIVKKTLKKDIKIVSHIHSCYQWLEKDGINKKIDSIFRGKYDLNIACGNLVYKFYEDKAPYFREAKRTTLSNSVDVRKIDNKKNYEIYSKFKIPREKKIVGFVGRLEAMKGLIPFIKELVKEKEKFEDCIFLLIGNGSQENEIKELIEENKLEQYFILVGFQKDVCKFYSIIDLFFLPSLYEGLPMVILEAMAFGIPVVSMDVGSINEIVNNTNGRIIEAENYKEFIKSIRYIKNDEKLMKSLGEKARKKIIEEYNFENYIERIEKKYKELILLE